MAPSDRLPRRTRHRRRVVRDLEGTVRESDSNPLPKTHERGAGLAAPARRGGPQASDVSATEPAGVPALRGPGGRGWSIRELSIRDSNNRDSIDPLARGRPGVRER